MSRLFIALLLSQGLLLFGQDIKKATELYQHTDYNGSLHILQAVKPPNAQVYSLMGKDYFMQGDFKQASEYFQKAFNLEPKSSDDALWLGRAWGRRAETGSVFTAPFSASKARSFFEQSVMLDPHNQEAMNDLFDYYLNAPGMLGGGMDKATALAKRIGQLDPAEGHFAEAQIADRLQQYDKAEQQLRRAMELAPRQVGRVLDLARYLAKRGRVQESEAVFAQADKVEPGSPKILFTRAKTYVESKRNLGQAKVLLKQYLQCNLTPDDPPREHAQKLLQQASAGT